MNSSKIEIDKNQLLIILKNSSWLVYDKLFYIVNAFFIGALVIRYLGPENYGQFSFVLAYLAIFQNLTQLGIGSIVVKKINNRLIDVETILSVSFILRSCSSIFFFLLSVSYALFYVKNISFVFLFISLSSLLLSNSEVFSYWFQSQLKNKKIAITNNIVIIFSSILKIFLVFNKFSVKYFSFVILFEALLTFLILYKIFTKEKKISIIKWDKKIAIEILKEALPLFSSGIGIIILSKSTQIMVHSFLDSKSLAYYSVAQMISDNSYILPMALHSSLFPILQKTKLTSHDLFTYYFEKIIFYTFLFSILISCFITFISPFLIHFIFGEKYIKSSLVLSVLIFNLIPVSISIMQSIWLNLENKNQIIFIQTISGAIICLLLNYIFIPNFGIVGGAFASVISQFLNVFVITSFLEPKLFLIQYNTLKNFIK